MGQAIIAHAKAQKWMMEQWTVLSFEDGKQRYTGIWRKRGSLRSVWTVLAITQRTRYSTLSDNDLKMKISININEDVSAD